MSDRELSALTGYRFAPQTFQVTRANIAKLACHVVPAAPVHFHATVATEKGHPAVIDPASLYINLGLTRGRILLRSDLGGDGRPAVEPFAGARGAAVEFREGIHAGDVITVEQVISEVVRKKTRSGPLPS